MDCEDDLDYEAEIDRISSLYRKAKGFVSELENEVGSKWEETGLEWDSFPFELVVEQGYYDGFTIGIVGKYDRLAEGFREPAWESLNAFEELPLSFADFWRNVDDLTEQMQAGIDNFAKENKLLLSVGRGYSQSLVEFNWN